MLSHSKIDAHGMKLMSKSLKITQAQKSWAAADQSPNAACPTRTWQLVKCANGWPKTKFHPKQQWANWVQLSANEHQNTSNNCAHLRSTRLPSSRMMYLVVLFGWRFFFRMTPFDAASMTTSPLDSSLWFWSPSEPRVHTDVERFVRRCTLFFMSRYVPKVSKSVTLFKKCVPVLHFFRQQTSIPEGVWQLWKPRFLDIPC